MLANLKTLVVMFILFCVCVAVYDGFHMLVTGESVLVERNQNNELRIKW